MKEWLKRHAKNSVRGGKYCFLAIPLLFVGMVVYEYCANNPHLRAQVNEEQLFVMCLSAAMILGTIIMTIVNDLRWETSGRAKYWPLLAFYANELWVWDKIDPFVAIYFGAHMTVAFICMELDDYLTAKGWGKPDHQPTSAQQ